MKLVIIVIFEALRYSDACKWIFVFCGLSLEPRRASQSPGKIDLYLNNEQHAPCASVIAIYTSPNLHSNRTVGSALLARSLCNLLRFNVRRGDRRYRNDFLVRSRSSFFNRRNRAKLRGRIARLR